MLVQDRGEYIALDHLERLVRVVVVVSAREDGNEIEILEHEDVLAAPAPGVHALLPAPRSREAVRSRMSAQRRRTSLWATRRPLFNTSPPSSSYGKIRMPSCSPGSRQPGRRSRRSSRSAARAFADRSRHVETRYGSILKVKSAPLGQWKDSSLFRTTIIGAPVTVAVRAPEEVAETAVESA